MYARSTCQRCSRSLAMNGDGRLRFHYCPHHTHCGLETCAECAASRDERHVGTNDQEQRTAGSLVEADGNQLSSQLR